MKEIRTEIEIESNITNVWNVLMNFEDHPKWNPFIKEISGQQNVGNKLTVSIKPPDGNGMTFKPVISVLDPEKEFRWIGKFLISGIFDGEHFFILESIDDNKTKFIHGEKFSGILVSFTGKMLEKTKEGFHSMNRAIKKECEKNIT